MSAADTVRRAAATPEQPQPYAELGLNEDEYARIREILGRRPTYSELAMYSVMWSEHCSYKSSKVHLRQFGEKEPLPARPWGRLLAGIGENAGVVDIGQGYAVTFKIESHNHPSYVEPYQGAATGVGGIVRDILAMGARPVAVMDPLRFGTADAATPSACCPGSSPASAATATASACPTSAARRSSTRPTPATRWSTRSVSVCCATRTSSRQGRRGRQQGDPVRRTDRRGRHRRGLRAGQRTFAGTRAGQAARASRSATRSWRSCSIECCLELFAAGVVAGIQDLGGAGLSCATSELAAAAGTAACGWSSTRCRCATRRSGRRRS